MDPKFFRKYSDLIESAENNKPVLTEGMLNDIKTQAMALFNKAKAMPGFSQAYQKAKTMTPQVQAILKTSKSGEEAMGRIQQLAKAPANENAFSQAAGVAAGAVGSIGAVATPFSSICAKLLDPLLTSAQATTFALPMLATSIALIGLGILLSTFTKGNIPGTDPDSAAYQNPNNKPMQEAEQATNETITGQIKSAVKNASLATGIGPRAQAQRAAVAAQDNKATNARKEYDLYNPLRIGHDPNDDAPRAAASAERVKQQRRLEKLQALKK